MSDRAIAGDPSFDRYARMARRTLRVPTALVVFIEEGRQVFLGASGLSEPFATERETPLSHSFCRYVVRDGRPLVVTDARRDERLKDSPAITELGAVSYAGWPLTDHLGRVIGSLCALDSRPHEWSHDELEELEDLAAACSSEIAQRELRRLAAERADLARDVSRRTRVLLSLSEGLAGTRTTGDISTAVERVALEELDCLRAGIWLRGISDPMRVPAPARRGVQPETMQFVDDTTTEWVQARTHAVLPLDGTSPLGEVALTGLPLFLADRVAQNDRFPALTSSDQIGEARAFMPLAVGLNGYGTLALVWPEAHEFSGEDRVMISALASYTAQAVQRALLLQERIDVALTLQTAMLSRLPSPDGLELAARYRPAGTREEVGGDWYDAVVLPGGQTTLAIGDVVGHDIRAAATMGELRNMLRALAWMHDDPPSVHVDRLDRAMRDLGLETFATLVHAQVQPVAESGERGEGPRSVRWTNAGHIPPVLVLEDGTVRDLDDADPADCMLGVAPELQRHDQTFEVPPGATLLMFTDGLVERRGDELGNRLDEVRTCVARHHALSLEDFVDMVLQDMVGDRPQDDVAMLAVRFVPGC